MTTGRINQVTTVRNGTAPKRDPPQDHPTRAPKGAFERLEFVDERRPVKAPSQVE